MTDRIVVPPNTIHKVRKPMDIGPLYQLIRYCYENDLRFGQALSSMIDFGGMTVLFYMENDELERRIKKFIKTNGLQQ